MRLIQRGSLFTAATVLYLAVAIVVTGCGDGFDPDDPDVYLPELHEVPDGGADDIRKIKEVAVKNQPKLHELPEGGADDIYEILVLDGGFLVASNGGGIARYEFTEDVPRLVRVYGPDEGLPSWNCFLLAKDMNGSVWASCAGGVGYLRPGADEWVSFTADSGLMGGEVTYMAMAPDGHRVWVTTTEGLATCDVNDLAWVSFPLNNAVVLLVHPTDDIVWCHQYVVSDCMCGRVAKTWEFSLESGRWTEVPDTETCSHVAPRPVYFSVKDNQLWLMRFAIPAMYDRATGRTITWSGPPDWRQVSIEDEDADISLDHILPGLDDQARLWFAGEEGLAAYDTSSGSWTLREPEGIRGFNLGDVSVVRTKDGNTIYVFGGDIASYRIDADEWRLLNDLIDGLNYYREVYAEAYLSPDEEYLWGLGKFGWVLISDVRGEGVRCLTDEDELGFDSAHLLRFVPERKLALIGTASGVIGTDYQGNVQFRLSRSTSPITCNVTRLAFAPDGSS